MEGLMEGDYTTDFLVKMKDGTFIVRECVYRSRITKPMNYKLLELSRSYWLHRGIVDWGCLINEKNEIYTHEDQIYRILLIKEDNCLVIDCNHNSMPVWKPVTTFWDASTMTDDLYTLLDFKPVEDDMVS